jgi:hypothetical protein
MSGESGQILSLCRYACLAIPYGGRIPCSTTIKGFYRTTLRIDKSFMSIPSFYIAKRGIHNHIRKFIKGNIYRLLFCAGDPVDGEYYQSNGKIFRNDCGFLCQLYPDTDGCYKIKCVDRWHKLNSASKWSVMQLVG